jgi:hypothetical protein
MIRVVNTSLGGLKYLCSDRDRTEKYIDYHYILCHKWSHSNNEAWRKEPGIGKDCVHKRTYIYFLMCL